MKKHTFHKQKLQKTKKSLAHIIQSVFGPRRPEISRQMSPKSYSLQSYMISPTYLAEVLVFQYLNEINLVSKVMFECQLKIALNPTRDPPRKFCVRRAIRTNTRLNLINLNHLTLISQDEGAEHSLRS